MQLNLITILRWRATVGHIGIGWGIVVRQVQILPRRRGLAGVSPGSDLFSIYFGSSNKQSAAHIRNAGFLHEGVRVRDLCRRAIGKAERAVFCGNRKTPVPRMGG